MVRVAVGAAKSAGTELGAMADIFISYAREERAVAAVPAKALERYGWCWRMRQARASLRTAE